MLTLSACVALHMSSAGGTCLRCMIEYYKAEQRGCHIGTGEFRESPRVSLRSAPVRIHEDVCNAGVCLSEDGERNRLCPLTSVFI